MTSIEIFKKATLDSIDRTRRSITATGIDAISGKLQTRTFQYIPDDVLEKAERYIARKDQPLIVLVDSGRKTIDFHPLEIRERVKKDDRFTYASLIRSPVP